MSCPWGMQTGSHRPGTSLISMMESPKPLLEDDVEGDPLRQFSAWFEEASRYTRMPEAMAVATATSDGVPSLRMVLLKRWDERGFVFHTHYDSRKARELATNPRAALLIHWEQLARQVRIEGTVDRLDREGSEEYFRTRPRGAQIGARASHQSHPIDGRTELERRALAVSREFEGAEVPLPDWWGGYLVRPHSFEFWQHREDRLHDRLLYSPWRGGWRIDRLQP